MAFAPSALIFIIYTIFYVLCFVYVLLFPSFFLSALSCSDRLCNLFSIRTLKMICNPTSLQSVILLLCFCLFFDNFRIAYGGFVSELSLSSFACELLVPLSAAHLIIVPMLIYPVGTMLLYLNSELDIDNGFPPFYITRHRKRTLMISGSLQFVLVTFGIFQFIQMTLLTDGGGEIIVESTAGGLQVCTYPQTSQFELVGVLGTSIWCLLVGYYLVRRYHYFMFLIVMLFSVLGQGVGAIFQNIFIIISNGFEVVFVIALVLLLNRSVERSKDLDQFESLIDH